MRAENASRKCRARRSERASTTAARLAHSRRDHLCWLTIREDHVLGRLNGWVGSGFAPENIDETVAALLSSQDTSADGQRHRERAKARLADAETRLRRHQTAIYAMIDSLGDVGAVLVDARSAGLNRLYDSLRLKLR